jgi:hypothetical protein
MRRPLKVIVIPNYTNGTLTRISIFLLCQVNLLSGKEEQIINLFARSLPHRLADEKDCHHDDLFFGQVHTGTVKPLIREVADEVQQLSDDKVNCTRQGIGSIFFSVTSIYRCNADKFLCLQID